MIKNKYPTTKPSLNLDFANTKSLDPRITFRRGTPGTYYDGVTHVKAEENLLSYSEDFANAYWTKIDSSITVPVDGVGKPDGSGPSEKLSPSSDNSAAHVLYKTLFVPDNSIASVHIQAAGMNYVSMVLQPADQTQSMGAQFDLANKKVIFTQNAEGEIIDVGNGWLRIILIPKDKNIGSTIPFVIEPNDGSTPNINSNFRTTYAGDGTSGIYLWGAQLEQRDAVTAYTSTMLEGGASAPITRYQPKLMTAAADHARFDHDPLTGESKGLLIEEQRTNLIAYSEDFTQSFWNENRSSTLTNDHVFPNQLIAPDGVSLATKIIPKNVNGAHYIGSGNLNVSANTVYTASCYFKAAEIDTVSIALKKYDGLNNWVNFNLTDVTATPVHAFDDYSIEDVGNGWRRCSVSLNLGAGADADAGLLYFYVKQASGWIGNNYDGLYMWGAQVEQATFPTSYIKSSGATAGTVRSADNASITGENFSSWYRQDEGSIYIEAGTAVDVSFTPYLGVGLDNGGDGYRFNSIMSYENNKIIFNNWNGTGTVVTNGLLINENGVSEKIAAVYKDNDFAMSANGSSVVSDTDGSHYKDMKTLYIGQTPYPGTNRYLGNCIKKLAYYPQRLTNEQLQNLTK